MVTLHQAITWLGSMQISIRSLQTHNVNRCGRSRDLARKVSVRKKGTSPSGFEMAGTESISSNILNNLFKDSGSALRLPRRFKILVQSIQLPRKRMLSDCSGVIVNYVRKSGVA